MRKGFTLIEVIISLVIISLLVGVIFRTYQSIVDISIRVDNYYKLTSELLFAHQTIQNLVDVWELDINSYMWADNKNTLESPQWYTTGINFLLDKKPVRVYYANSWLVLQKDWQTIALTDTWIAVIPKLIFRLQPTKNVWSWFVGAYPIWRMFFGPNTNISDIQHPGFWMIGTIQIRYSRSRAYFVDFPIQSFFNFRSY